MLSEALNIPTGHFAAVKSRHKEAKWHGEGFVWKQYLDISEVNGVTYLDQGNGAQELAQPK